MPAELSCAKIGRRPVMLAAVAATAAAAWPAMAAQALPPIVFVHGNGEGAALWLTTLWRFESNGWPPERLHAIHLPYPTARSSDDRPQPARSSTTEHRQFLAAQVAQVLAATGAEQVVLIGNSRGGYPIRSFIMNGGAAQVSHAILGGVPNHGVLVDAVNNPAGEFNGAGPFLKALNNQGESGVEVTPGPRWMTIRSDNYDKYAQPDGLWIGAPGKPTGVSFDGPELRGALNVVLPGLDHKETSFSAPAFAAMFQFITGRAPATTGFTPQDKVVLSGQVSGIGVDNQPVPGALPSNLPLAGALVEVFAVHAATGERQGAALCSGTVGADGRWGPISLGSKTALEFVVAAPGYAITHIYRSAFARSSNIVHLRADVLLDADKSVGAVLSFTRPRGYFGLPRDSVVFDGQDPAPGIPRGVAGLAVTQIKLPSAPQRAVVASFNGQRIVGRSWPATENHIVQLELH